jgi:hypothetical protein
MPRGVSAKIVSARRLKNLRLVVAGITVTAAVLIALLINQPQCGVYRSDKTITIDFAKIETEVVQTAAERTRGLSDRPCIGANHGMLFIFDEPGQYPFWMKNMKFPIDIVWIDANHKVVDLSVNVSPSTYPDTFVSKTPAQYVLELQAKRSKDLNVTIGTPINF